MDKVLGVVEQKFQVIRKPKNQRPTFSMKVLAFILNNFGPWQRLQDSDEPCFGLFEGAYIGEGGNGMIGIRAVGGYTIWRGGAGR